MLALNGRCIHDDDHDDDHDAAIVRLLRSRRAPWWKVYMTNYRDMTN